ncbi:MAG TPA: hypothetical protein PKK96_09270 [Anaerolineales bacterium]|jgi:hypothetical protein|nr:hypothetical protein [Anaerolineales bacterium]HNQ95632.1 hypothetical protein [Anaerolineales bacterium]HNS61181.1 hypothetical protein [Anaerolineales bacterium]
MARASISSKPYLDWRVIVAFAALIAVGLYLLMSAMIVRVGFPLDDTWIHLTYARNFAEHGEWAFRLGEQSAGSTSPLWTLLLSIGYVLHLAPYAWTFFLGWLMLTLLAIFAEASARKLQTGYQPRIPWVGIFFTFAWHLTWAATSGMETLLHALLIFLVLTSLIRGSSRYAMLGLFAGLSVWVRPDGATLLGPILFTIAFNEKSWFSRGRSVISALIGFGVLFLLYLLFNLALSGNPMPNTFYAKQAEYQAGWLSQPLKDRLVDYLLPIFASPFIALFPGAVGWVGGAIRNRNWGALAGVIWFMGYILIYFLRLPPYQHGRYIIPAFPILYLWGLLGMVGFMQSAKLNLRMKLLWKTLVAALLVVFFTLGGLQNADDVFWVESEMVATAKWVNQNIPPAATLAVHDIGAMGYLVSNPLVDLAGLVDPEVIPFIRDETRLADYLNDRSVEYLIVPPGFYKELIENREIIFISGEASSSTNPNEHMLVLKWK